MVDIAQRDITARLLTRFFSHVDITDECWEWTGACIVGYGQLHLSNPKRTTRTHRLSWVIFYGSIPENMQVCHTCDNPLCVRPEHLFIGTGADNMRDKTNKGRGNYCGRKKLSDEQVLRIRQLHAINGLSQTRLAEKFDVSVSLISEIVNNKVRV